MCDKCMKMCGGTFAALGVLFLLRDLAIWNFWNVQWWTALFLAAGIGALGSSACPDCNAIRKGKK